MGGEVNIHGICRWEDDACQMIFGSDLVAT